MLVIFLLFAAPVPADAPEDQESATEASGISARLNASTDQESAKILSTCLEKHFPVLIEEPHKGTVADYLSRFYGHTDAFHKARRCDSFMIRRQISMPDQVCHMAVFSYDDNKQVDRIRKMEPKESTNLRTPPTADAPGRLEFKGPLEYYRVFFLDKRIVFFFWGSRISLTAETAQPYPEDSGLFDVALKALEECPQE